MSKGLDGSASSQLQACLRARNSYLSHASAATRMRGKEKPSSRIFGHEFFEVLREQLFGFLDAFRAQAH